MKPIIVGNWKMHKTLAEAAQYVEQVGDELAKLQRVDVVLCPPFISLAVMADMLKNSSVHLGAQNVAAWEDGAYTGEVSASMVAPHCQFVIIGHSERRKMGETPELVNSKVGQAISAGLEPVVCISNEDELSSLAEMKDKAKAWVVAYEPLSAIGSGKPEAPEEVKRMYQLIKTTMGPETRAIYGGSVTAENVLEYVPMCDGALPGGASLDPDGFLALCQQIEHNV